MIGGPGVDKETFCGRVAREFDFDHIRVGSLLRTEGENAKSPYRKFIPERIRRSVLLPAQLTTLLLIRRIAEGPVDGPQRFLLDGIPRSVVGATGFELKVRNYESIC